MCLFRNCLHYFVHPLELSTLPLCNNGLRHNDNHYRTTLPYLYYSPVFSYMIFCILRKSFLIGANGWVVLRDLAKKIFKKFLENLTLLFPCHALWSSKALEGSCYLFQVPVFLLPGCRYTAVNITTVLQCPFFRSK